MDIAAMPTTRRPHSEAAAPPVATALARFWADLLPPEVPGAARERFEATLRRRSARSLDPLLVLHTCAARPRDRGALNEALHAAGLGDRAEEWLPLDAHSAATTHRLTVTAPGAAARTSVFDPPRPPDDAPRT